MSATPSPEAGPDGVVVVQNRWFLRALSPVILVLGLLALWGAWEVATGDQVTGVARVIVVLLLLPLAVACLVGAPTGLLMRETFAPTEITVRPAFRTRRIALADATEIRSVRAAVHTGRFQIPIGRLQVVGPRSPRGVAVRAILDETLTHADDAARVLDAWVRQRPELVADHPDVRRIFEERGVLQPLG